MVCCIYVTFFQEPTNEAEDEKKDEEKEAKEDEVVEEYDESLGEEAPGGTMSIVISHIYTFCRDNVKAI